MSLAVILALGLLGCAAVLGLGWYGIDLRLARGTAVEAREHAADIVPEAPRTHPDGGEQIGDQRAEIDAAMPATTDGGIHEASADASEAQEDAGTQMVEDSGVSEGGVAPEEVQAVTIAVSTFPRRAKIFVDDAVVPENPFKGRFPRDGLSHRIRAEARGYRPAGKVVVFDRDVDLSIRLRKIRRFQPQRPAKSVDNHEPWSDDQPSPGRTKTFEERDPWD